MATDWARQSSLVILVMFSYKSQCVSLVTGSQVWIHNCQHLSHIWPVQIMAGEDELDHNYWARRSEPVLSRCRTVSTSRALNSRNSNLHSHLHVQRTTTLWPDLWQTIFWNSSSSLLHETACHTLYFNIHGMIITRLSHGVTHASQ